MLMPLGCWPLQAHKVAILGAGGGIGQPLALLTKMLPEVSELSLYGERLRVTGRHSHGLALLFCQSLFWSRWSTHAFLIIIFRMID